MAVRSRIEWEHARPFVCDHKEEFQLLHRSGNNRIASLVSFGHSTALRSQKVQLRASKIISASFASGLAAPESSM